MAKESSVSDKRYYTTEERKNIEKIEIAVREAVMNMTAERTGDIYYTSVRQEEDIL